MQWTYQHVGSYLRCMRLAFAVLREGGRVRLHWNDSPMDLPAFRRQCFWPALDARINAKAGLDRPAGRKDDPDYQTRLMRDARRVREILS